MINEFIKNKQFTEAYLEFIKLHPHDQAELLKELDLLDQVRLLNKMNDEELSELLSYLDSSDSAKLIMELDLERQKQILDNMDIDDAVDIIDELQKEDQDTLLNILDEQENIEKLLVYEEDEAGSLMTSKYIEINSNMDVKDAMRNLIDLAPDVESITTLFVVDNNKYIGTVNLNQLIKTKSPNKIESLLVKTPFVYDYDDIDMAIYQMRKYGLSDMPVCNSKEQLIGIITLDDAIEAYSEEAIEDFAKLAAVNEHEEKNIFKAALHRLPWLIILLLASIPIAMASESFDEVIVSVTILALFQPLILDASGDVATQTLAVTLRKLSQQDGADIKEGMTEILTGVINGFILGLASFLITMLLSFILKADQPVVIALVVGLSLWITVIIGPILGFVIPVFLNKIKIDPAVASGPFITTLVDILSLIIYFGFATLFLL